jgi:carboxypeptidase family protein
MSRNIMFRRTLSATILLSASVCGAFAQTRPAQGAQTSPSAPASAPGTFSGRLTGSGMDGATVTVTSSANGASQTATTSSDGTFTFTNLMPGSYRVMVRLKSGLQLAENTLEVTPAGGQLQVAFTSGPAGAAPNLELDGTAPTVETNSAEVSRSYDSQTIRSLPILDRQHQELITLMPGITPPVTATDRINDPQRTRTFNVNGQPAYTNLYNQDGAYDNEPFSGRPLRTEPNEAVQALEVRTSNYNAEYGIAAGSWASTITRPGTNALHGSLFEFNTNNYFRNGRALAASQTSPRFNTNQFGATAGAAAIPDKMFWFFSYEGYIQRGRQEAVATVPAAGFASGNFSQVPGATIFNPQSTVFGASRTPFSGNTIPATQLNATSQRILGQIPAANLPGFSNNLVGSVPLLDDDHRLDGKIDYRFSEKTTGFLRYGFTQASVDQGSLLGAVGSPLNSEFRGMNAVASITQILTTDLLAEFRLGYDRYRNQVAPWNTTGIAGLTGFPNGLPSINISGFSPLGLPANVPRKETDNVFDGASNWMYHTGMHSLKIGVGARELQSNGFSNPFFSSLGSFQFGPGATLGTAASAASLSPGVLQANALAAFLIGAPTQSGISSFTMTPAYRQRQYSAYLTDTLNLFQKVYLELGVRYDIFSPLEPGQAGGAVVYDPATNTTSTLGVNGVGLRSSRTDLDNVAPRIGIAFRPTNRFVFRTGYGIHYFPVPFYLTAFNPAVQGVQSGITGGIATTTFANPTIPASGTTAPNQPFIAGQRDVNTPYVQTYSGMIQGDAGNGFLLDVGYVGNRGRQLPFEITRTGLPGSGLTGQVANRTAALIQTGTGLNSNYNSLQVNLTKRFAAGLSFAGAYTYGKALDYGTNLLDPFNRGNNYGPADWDRTHILSVSHDWRLPFKKSGWVGRAVADWEITGILRWATGTPYTVTADPLACGCLGASAVPAAFNSSSSSATINGSASFNPGSFASPAAGTFGNLSRNAFRGPDMFVYNAALFRNFSVRENIKLEFRGEAYNLTNTSNPMNPVSNFTTPGFGTSTGNIDALAGRQFQVAARILF